MLFKKDVVQWIIINFPFISHKSLEFTFTFHDSYVILRVVPRTVILWTERSY